MQQQPDAEKVLILPTAQQIQIPTEIDAQPVDAAAAVQSLQAAIDRLQETLNAAALMRTERDISAAEPPRTEADTAAAEAAAMTLQPLPESKAVRFPLDKVTSTLCDLPRSGRALPLKAESDKDAAAGLAAYIFVTLDTMPGSGLTLDRPITPYEKLVLLSCMGLWYDGVAEFTLNQLFARMGGETNPNAKQRGRLENALDSLLATLITIDNSSERQLYPDRPTAFYRTQLLQGGYAGKVTRRGLEARVFRIDNKPVLLDFAERRKQVCAIPLDIFRDGESMTDRSLATRDYLIRRIAHMKRPGNVSRTILLETVAGAVGVDYTHREQRRRLKESIRRRLAHFSARGWIRGFTISGGAARIDL